MYVCVCVYVTEHSNVCLYSYDSSYILCLIMYELVNMYVCVCNELALCVCYPMLTFQYFVGRQKDSTKKREKKKAECV